MWKTKTFRVAILTIISGLSGGVLMLMSEPPQVDAGVAAIIAALSAGAAMMTGRSALLKIEKKIDKEN